MLFADVKTFVATAKATVRPIKTYILRRVSLMKYSIRMAMTGSVAAAIVATNALICAKGDSS